MNKVPPLCVPLVEGCSSELDWIAKPPRQGEPRNPPTYERDLIAGGGLILGKGAFGVTRLAQSSLTGEYYAVRSVRGDCCLKTPPNLHTTAT